ncbi:MAG: hypothetical protein Q9M28_05110 [Mariprofundaceae bacterium]|nr:hypothetical protein [Mariprofundaceae bacterium]
MVGLGRVGSDFLSALQSRQDLGIEIVCVSELENTIGKKKAVSAGIGIKITD